MRRIFLASVATLFATSALAAPHFNVTGGTVNAGNPVNFIIHRTSRDQSAAVIAFTTADGTSATPARAGTDYAGTSTVISFPNGFSSLVIPVATYVDQAHLGTTLQFSGRIKVSGRTASTAGANIVEPAAAPPPPPPPAPTPPPVSPAVEPVVTPNGTAGEFNVADNFDVQTTLIPTTETVPASLDPVGAFRFTCLAGQLAHDDPIVYPGQPGASHLHQFFGNTGTNASSTYNSLRTTGGSTCTRDSSNVSLNPTGQRTAYWMPAMLDGAGDAVKPDLLLTYYKELPKSDPACGAPDATHIGYCIPIPNGLRYILGYNMATGLGGPVDTNSPDYWKMGFDCYQKGGNSLTGTKHTMADIVATGLCPAGSWLRVFVTFKDCWDGVNLDTVDHRSHMAYGDGALIESFKRACPADHPYNIPEVAVQAFFTTDANFVAGKWSLSSDAMVPGIAAGTTLHMDYWEAWSPFVKNLWQTGCIDGHLSCNVGETGTGQTVNGMAQVAPYPDHVLVPLSSIP